jgi:hypothetical protein
MVVGLSSSFFLTPIAVTGSIVTNLEVGEYEFPNIGD